MATDPIRGVREHETVLDSDAQHALTAIARVSPSEEAPYLTVYLDQTRMPRKPCEWSRRRAHGGCRPRRHRG